MTVNKAQDLVSKIRSLRMPDGSFVQLEIPKKTKVVVTARILFDARSYESVI